MNYNLTNKEDRKRFVRYANSLLKGEKALVSLEDKSNRTLSQNCYIHVLCRIMAQETGTTEYYAKQVYFKEIANPDLFVRVTKDPLTGQMVKTIRSSTELTVGEMSKAIDSFIRWAEEQGYTMPEATTNEDGTMTFNTPLDEMAFNQAEVETSKNEQYL